MAHFGGNSFFWKQATKLENDGQKPSRFRSVTIIQERALTDEFIFAVIIGQLQARGIP